MRSEQPRSPSGVEQLVALFERNGYVRRQNRKRLQAEGWRRYKKGSELRLVAASESELQVIQRLLRQAGFKPGRPFAKGRQFRQPVYGRDAVARFLALVAATRKHRKANKARQDKPDPGLRRKELNSDQRST
ncbi:MAG: hypothetical protein HY712_00500 [candidate division NC10 bacterium]|nr:hypothetical protein [candidate division NC10 bacterium]